MIVMGILQCVGELLHVGKYLCKRELCAAWMLFSQHTTYGMLHHKHRSPLLKIKFEYTNNMRMFQAHEHLRFKQEAIRLLLIQRDTQNLQRGLALEIAVLSEIDLSKCTLAEQMQKAVIP